MITDQDLNKFLADVKTMHDAHMDASYSSLRKSTFTAEKGKKFARIVEDNGCQRSAFCFVDLATGDILKTDGWKRPAPKPRGHIRNGSSDLTPYGAQYLR